MHYIENTREYVFTIFIWFESLCNTKEKRNYTISSSIKKKYKQNELKTLHHYVQMSSSGR